MGNKNVKNKLYHLNNIVRIVDSILNFSNKFGIERVYDDYKTRNFKSEDSYIWPSVPRGNQKYIIDYSTITYRVDQHSGRFILTVPFKVSPKRLDQNFSGEEFLVRVFLENVSNTLQLFGIDVKYGDTYPEIHSRVPVKGVSEDIPSEIVSAIVTGLFLGKDAIEYIDDSGVLVGGDKQHTNSKTTELSRQYEGIAPGVIALLADIDIKGREHYINHDKEYRELLSQLIIESNNLHRCRSIMCNEIYGELKNNYLREVDEVCLGIQSNLSILDNEPGINKEKFLTNLNKWSACYNQVKTLKDSLRILDESYTGWNRWYVVPGGHVHSNMYCSTLHKGRTATKLLWIVELSGTSKGTALDILKEGVCTVCFRRGN